MKLLLLDRNPDIVQAWRKYFQNLDVDIQCGKFQDLPNKRNCVLTTSGNSFGIMGGGLDKQIANYIPNVQQRVRLEIDSECAGFLPPGQAFLLQVSDEKDQFQKIIYTSTMFIPTDISKTFNVYYVMRSVMNIFTYIDAYAPNTIVVVPGFGGGIGNVHPESIAQQMFLAYKHVIQPDIITLQKANYYYTKLLEITRKKYD